jgi:predicted GTPase
MCKGMVVAEDNFVVKQWRRPYTEGVLTEEELEHYWSEGYVVKKNLLTAEQLEPVKEAINRRALVLWLPHLQGACTIRGTAVRTCFDY